MHLISHTVGGISTDAMGSEFLPGVMGVAGCYFGGEFMEIVDEVGSEVKKG